MTDLSLSLEKAARQALEWIEANGRYENSKVVATSLRQALEQSAQEEPVTLLPDGSAFAVLSYPLPKDHWLYAERQYAEGADEPVELGKPVLTHALRAEVVSAVRYAIRGATNCGKDVDFDPDALVQNAVYALCGPYVPVEQPAQQCPTCQGNDRDAPCAYPSEGKTGCLRDARMYQVKQPAQDQGQSCYCPECERLSKELDAIKAQQEPVAVKTMSKIGKAVGYWRADLVPPHIHPDSHDITPLYTSPPAQRKPLTDEQVNQIIDSISMYRGEYSVAIFRAAEKAHGIGEKS